MFKDLIDMYLGYFAAHGEPALLTICNCKIPSDIILIDYKKLMPIEDLPDKEKKDLKQYVIDLFPDKTIEEKLNCCKIIYTIGTLL